MLQYITKTAYTGNTSVELWKDGKRMDHTIMADYQVEGYILAIEAQGYERAYDVDYFKRKYEEARDNYIRAQGALNLAERYPLVKESDSK